MPSKRALRRIVLIVSIALFVASLTQKCYCTTSYCGDSFFIFLFGPLGFYLSLAGATWLANPLLITSWIKVSKEPKLSFWTSLLAATISLSFLLFKNVMDNENGDLREIVSYSLGYWLWLASCLSMLIGNSFLNSKRYLHSS